MIDKALIKNDDIRPIIRSKAHKIKNIQKKLIVLTKRRRKLELLPLASLLCGPSYIKLILRFSILNIPIKALLMKRPFNQITKITAQALILQTSNRGLHSIYSILVSLMFSF